MSALTDDISRRHWRLGVGHPGIDVCLCGWKQHRDARLILARLDAVRADA